MEAIAPLAAAGIITLELDVTVSDSVAKAREEIVRLSGGKLHILVNNAYVFLFHSVSVILTYSTVDRVCLVNLLTLF